MQNPSFTSHPDDLVMRRHRLRAAAALPLTRVASGLASAGGVLAPLAARAEDAPSRRFEPAPGHWRTCEVRPRIHPPKNEGPTRVWFPVPAVQDRYQRPLWHEWSGNAARATLVGDGTYGAAMVHAEFDAATAAPTIEVVSRVATQDRALDWRQRTPAAIDASVAAFWTRATRWMPTDGIVHDTAERATRGARTDVDKVRALFDWIVDNTYREPKVRGCGVGDIRAMLETGNLGGKCGDINALFVGMARSVGVPARDVYGIRLAPSAFGYRELGARGDVSKAQHCRAEVYLRDYGWVAMDPADVGKVMRLETSTWIKDVRDPLVAPVKRGLYGGWEGNWMAYNVAHDVKLPGASQRPPIPFFMYPEGENAKTRFDPLEPEFFEYRITARELTA